MQILMVRGTPVQVSDEDFEWLQQWRWRVGGWGYVLRSTHDRSIKENPVAKVMHREIWKRMGKEIPPKHEIDHRDRDRLNNQRGNLRVLTRSANNLNRSNVKGYSWHPFSGLWHARIRKDDREHSLGYFHSEEEARAAYEAGKRLLYPELYDGG